MKAEYIDHMGSDLTVVNAARVSFDKQSEAITDKDEGLIRYLARNKHWTPFAHCTLTIRETVPIFVARQRFKHTVGFTYNEVSRRYVSDAPEFYIPSEWRSAPEGSIKQGSGRPVIKYINDEYNDRYQDLIDDAALLYRNMITDGIAPEQARMVLPQSMYTSYYVTGSLYAWASAYKLRSDSHAQLEIQELASEWDTIVGTYYPLSWNALTGE